MSQHSIKLILFIFTGLTIVLAAISFLVVVTAQSDSTTVQYLNQFWFEAEQSCTWNKNEKCNIKTRTDINKFEDKENGVVCYITTTGDHRQFKENYNPNSSISCLKTNQE